MPLLTLPYGDNILTKQSNSLTVFSSEHPCEIYTLSIASSEGAVPHSLGLLSTQRKEKLSSFMSVSRAPQRNSL